MNMNQPLSSHFAMEVVPKRDHAITNSLLSLSWYLAWTVSADVGGAMIERVGYEEPLMIAAGALRGRIGASTGTSSRTSRKGAVPRADVEIAGA